MTVAERSKKVQRKIIKIDEELCNGCGKCVIGCEEGALAIVDGKAKVVNEVFCDGLGACIGECPQGALEIVEREAYEFDEQAVEEHLEKIKDRKNLLGKTQLDQGELKNQHCSCPSSRPISFESPWQESSSKEEIPSALRQWPTKLTLVNPNADYFNNEELLIISDCAPVAYGDVHRKIIKGKPLVTTCPMLSLNENNLTKLEEILKSNPIKTVHLILMEVPCCQKIKLFLDPILKSVDREIILKQTIIKRDGSILQREKQINYYL